MRSEGRRTGTRTDFPPSSPYVPTVVCTNSSRGVAAIQHAARHSAAAEAPTANRIASCVTLDVRSRPARPPRCEPPPSSSLLSKPRGAPWFEARSGWSCSSGRGRAGAASCTCLYKRVG